MLNGASLTDATLAYPHFAPFHHHHATHLTTRLTAAHNGTSNGGGLSLTENGHSSSSSLNGHSNGSIGGVSSASAMATLTAAAALAAASSGLPPNVKDSRWLTLEVCRQFQRNQCSRDENECKFAHPPTHVDIQNGRVVCCYDSIKGKCQRRDPPCKYLHPPMHLREQLMMNGRNNMMLRNWQMQLAQQHYLAHPGMYPVNQAAAVAAVAAAAAASCSPPVPTPSSTGSVPVTNDPNSVMYPGPTPLTLTNPFLNISYSPYLGALASTNLSNGQCTPNMSSSSMHFHDGMTADCGLVATSALKRPVLTDIKNGLSLFHHQLHHPNQHHHHHHTEVVPISTCASKLNVMDTNGSTNGCLVIMNGTSNGSGVISSHLDSNGVETSNNSPNAGCQLTIMPTTATTVVSGTSTGEQQLAAAVAAAYNLQAQSTPPPPQAPNQAAVVAASMLNVHGAAPQLAGAVPFTATAAVNGATIGAGNHHAAAAHYPTITADPTGYFHPTYQFELQPFPYH